MSVEPVHDIVAGTLARLGHDTMFGLVGSGNFKFAEHFADAHRGRFTWTRHEAAAVSAAHAYAHVTGRLGIATVHQGPGLTNTLTALTLVAKESHPVLLVAGETARGQHSNQTVALDAAVTAAGAHVERFDEPDAAAHATARAARRAESERCAVVLPLPIDLQELPARRGDLPVPPSMSTPRTPPASRDIDAVAELVARSARPLILGGRGAVLANARAPLEALADRIGALLATTLMANGLFAGHPASLGVCGGYGSSLVERLVPDADLILAFGASLNRWTTMSGRLLGDATLVQCDTDPAAIGGHCPVSLALVGDAAETADALELELERRGYRSTGYRDEAVMDQVASYSAATEHVDEAGEGFVDPRTVAATLDRMLPAERTVVYDCGGWTWFPTPYLSVPDPAGFVPAQTFMAVGHGLANAIGAAVARPDRPVLALVGDGGAMMALGELDSIAAQQLDVLVVIINDAGYGAEVHHFGPMGRSTKLVEHGDRDFAAIAASLGAGGAAVRSVTELEDSISTWLTRGRGATVLDCKVDPRIVSHRLAEAFASEPSREEAGRTKPPARR